MHQRGVTYRSTVALSHCEGRGCGSEGCGHVRGGAVKVCSEGYGHVRGVAVKGVVM